MKLANAVFFEDSVRNVFSTMLHVPVTCGPPRVLSEGSPTSDVTGIITFGGDVVGAMVLSFPAETARKSVKALAGVDEPDIHAPVFLDAIGELANMVAGGAKARYVGYESSISIPTVVCGPAHHVNRQQRAPWVVVGCECPLGNFIVAMSLVEKVK